MGVAFLVLFGAIETLGVPLLTAPQPWLERGGLAAGALGLGLLVADVLLPVPAAAVMIAHGALFGVVPGALLSLAGSLGATAAGWNAGLVVLATVLALSAVMWWRRRTLVAGARPRPARR